MSPKRIVKRAKKKKLDIIGICDHNSAENVQATINAAHKICRDRVYPCPQQRIKVLPGMEITTAEEIHILALFDHVEDVLALQGSVYPNLPPEENKPEVFGEQIIANEFDEVEGFNTWLLISATKLPLTKVLQKIHKLNGLAIGSHIDRPSFSIIGQLGFIPDDLEIDAVEISPNITPAEAIKKYPEIQKFPIITCSDAHFLNDIGKATTTFLIEEPTIAEIKKAMRNEEGRKYEVS